jgi:hypothetical protein
MLLAVPVSTEIVMVFKQLLFRSAAREKIVRDATQLADAIRITLGPKYKSLLILKQWGAPIVRNDGVAIAKEVSKIRKGISVHRYCGRPRRRPAILRRSLRQQRSLRLSFWRTVGRAAIERSCRVSDLG